MKKIVIAIDGYSACGKSTLSKQLAKKLNYKFLDTGAMYRAVTYYLIENNVHWINKFELHNALKQIKINFHFDNRVNQYRTFVNGKDVEEQLRSMQVSNLVSEISSIAEVRKLLVDQQRKIALRKEIVLDGRDIGTIVLPKAELKIFVVADMKTRIERRYKELIEAGINVTHEEIEKNLQKRDHDETTRTDSPLYKADDAILLDNTKLTQEEQLELVYTLALQKME